MFSSVRKALSCVKKNPDDDSDNDGVSDNLLWSRDLERHAYGEFSLAVCQANAVLEDQSQIEAARNFTFVGVYDGHGGPDASRFLCDNMFDAITRCYELKSRTEGMPQVIKVAMDEIEDSFTNQVVKTRETEPLKAVMGSSCLLGIIHGGVLSFGHIGDSRAVIGVLDKHRSNKIKANPLTFDHNVNSEEERKDFQAKFNSDPNIFVKRGGTWLIKGRLEVSRSIGDVYLKYPELAIGPEYPEFHLAEPITQAVVRRDSDASSMTLRQRDQFVIFATRGFWQHVSNQSAVDTVFRHPHAGIARRLVKMALKKAALKAKRGYDEVKQMNNERRREIHDDMTVAVIFIDYEWLKRESPVHEVSVRGFPYVYEGPSLVRLATTGEPLSHTAEPFRSGPDEPGPSLALSGTAEPSSSGAVEPGSSLVAPRTSEPSNPRTDTTELPGFRREGKEPMY